MRLWEQDQSHSYAERDRERMHILGSNAEGTRTHRADLASVLTVFDTLAEACFCSFDNHNIEVLSEALAAILAADSAIRRASYPRISKKTGPARRTVAGRGVTVQGGLDSPGINGRETASTLGTVRKGTDRPETGAGVSLAVEYGTSVGRARADGNASLACSGEGGLGEDRGGQGYAGTGSGGSRTDINGMSQRPEQDANGAGLGEPNAEQDGDEPSGAWIRDSRTVEVIRGLMRRCRDYPHPQGGSGEDGVGSGVGLGSRARVASVGSEPGFGESLATATAFSFVDLAEALVDGVGPEVTGHVLAACPALLEGMPPKVRPQLL